MLQDTILEMNGLTRKKIDGDGNCQFASVAFAMGDDAPSARQKAVAWIRDHLHLEDYKDLRIGILNSKVPDQGVDPARMSDVQDSPEDQAEKLRVYLERMEHDGTWGDNITLQALAEVYGRVICVIKCEDDLDFHHIKPQESDEETPFVHVFYHQNLHYDVLEHIQKPSPSLGSHEVPWQITSGGQVGTLQDVLVLCE